MAVKIYNVIQTILIALSVFTFLILGGAKLALGINAYVVVSGSMEPAIPTGSLCFVDKTKRQPEPGEIVAFQRGQILVTHRVIAAESGVYRTKGDNNSLPDPAPALQEEILGKTIFWIPKVGYAVAFFQTEDGFLAAITALTAFILIGYLLPGRGKLSGKRKMREIS